MDWTVIVVAAIGGGLFKSIVDYFLNRRTTRIDETTKIQAVYEKTLDDMTDRHEKEKNQLEKENAKLQGQLDSARQSQAEMLVMIEDMKNKLNKVGDDVNFITGDLKKYPFAGDGTPHGRRATDKPQT